MQKKKFIIYRRDARKGSSAYSPKPHSAPHFETKHGMKAVTMVEEPSVWTSRRSGSGFLTMYFLNASSPLQQPLIMDLP